MEVCGSQKVFFYFLNWFLNVRLRKTESANSFEGVYWFIYEIKPLPCWVLSLWNNLYPRIVNSNSGKLELSFVLQTKNMSKLFIKSSKYPFFINIKMAKE